MFRLLEAIFRLNIKFCKRREENQLEVMPIRRCMDKHTPNKILCVYIFYIYIYISIVYIYIYIYISIYIYVIVQPEGVF